MYLALAGVDLGLGYVLALVWGIAAVLVGHAATRRSGRLARRTARIAAGFAIAGLVLAAVRLVVVALIAVQGWVFLPDRKLVTLLLLIAPAVAVPAALRRLRTLRGEVAGEADAAVPEHLRGALAAPGVVVPLQATAFGALGGFFELYLQPDGALVVNLLVLGVLLGVITLLLVLRARRRSARLATPQARLRVPGRTWLLRLGAAAVVVAAVVGLVVAGSQASKLPASYSMTQGEADLGGGQPLEGGHHGTASDTGATSVVDLAGPANAEPDRRFTLTAQQAQLRLSSGATVSAWAFNGQIPGPELRAREGELVEVTLVNQLPDAPVTVHWHGVDVPAREDGVAGVTQDAVPPGGTYTYRFRLEESGTRWYHSHQAASEQVQRGLFGPLVIEPAQQDSTVDQDVSVVMHDWDTDQGVRRAMGIADVLDRRKMEPGNKVRLRILNASTISKTVTLTGVPYRVTALDGTAVAEPAELNGNQLVIGGANRYDVEFTMPPTPVRLVESSNADAGILWSPDGTGEVTPILDGPEFDPTTYGRAQPTPFDSGATFNREFDLLMDEQFGFYNGQFTARKTVNGTVFPDVPMHMVREGELVKMRFVNRDTEDHPMHLHGHHFLVLSRNGERPTGSPMWLDTLNVRPGEVWEVGFRADNPGIWMDHCHNFLHTKLGMVLHLAYENVTTPFVVGGEAGNHPD